jgi:arylsulfatase A-like enzyme
MMFAQRQRAAQPNVVLIVMDTARADAFEPYGAVTGSSPVIADFAASGMLARRAYATANWTFPSHISLLTGVLPNAMGLLSGGDAAADAAGNAQMNTRLRGRSLPAVLSAAGYHTRAASANPWVTPAYGFTSFDEFTVVGGTRRAWTPPPHGMRGGALTRARTARVVAGRTIDAVTSASEDGSDQLEKTIGEWIQTTDPTRPFFWFLNSMDCHSPYQPKRRYAALGPMDRIRMAADQTRFLTVEAIALANCGDLVVPADTISRIRRAYAGGVASVDAWFGRVLDRLADAGILDDTLIVVTSDHGENLGESGRIGHGYWLDERLIRVPLMARGPVSVGLDGVVSLASIPRLIAEAIGLDWHPWKDNPCRDLAVAHQVPFASRSHAELVRRVQAGEISEYAAWRLSTRSTAVTDGTLKLIREGDDDWLYDLSRDPSEIAPERVDGRLVAVRGPAVERLRSMADRQSVMADSTAIRGAGNPSVPVATDLVDRMRALGYL